MCTTCLTIEKVIQRALALQLVIDRGWSEYNISNHVDEENTKDFIEFASSWSGKNGISEWLTEREKRLWDKQAGDLNIKEAAYCTWQTEALVPLLWALGLKETMPDYAEHAEEDHHKLLHFGQDYPLKKILEDIDAAEDACLQKMTAEIKTQAELYKLVCWRCAEYLYNNRKINMNVEPMGVFGENIHKAVALLPLDAEGELLVRHASLAFDQMNENDVQKINLLAQNRLHALNWLIGQDENWDAYAMGE